MNNIHELLRQLTKNMLFIFQGILNKLSKQPSIKT